jgi:hypothetical protein
MLRLLALLAGLVLLALLVVVSLRNGTRERIPAPEPIPAAGDARATQESLSATDRLGRNEAGEPIAPDARYVGIVGDLRREEDDSFVDGGVVTFNYRYLSKGPDSDLRKVDVEVDEHGRFEQLFSEPVQLVSCSIEAAPVDHPQTVMGPGVVARASFLNTSRVLDLRIDSRDVAVSLQVPSGLEIRGIVIEESTRVPVPNALVWSRVALARTLVTTANTRGMFSLRGLDPRIAASDRTCVDETHSGDHGTILRDLVLYARCEGHAPGKTELALPLDLVLAHSLEISLRPCVRVSGRVLNPQGEGVTHACLRLLSWTGTRPANDSDAMYPEYAFTNDYGEFAFECVPSGDGGELRADRPAEKGALRLMVLGSLRQDREGVEVRLPDTQLYRIKVRGLEGKLLRAHEFTLLVRNTSGEQDLNPTGFSDVLRTYLPVGERSELLVASRTGTLHARTSIEPLERHEEPETVIIDLEP